MKKVSNNTISYDLRGMLMPINPVSSNPVFLELEGQLLLPIFSAKQKFDEAAKWGGFSFAKYSLITDPDQFIKSVLEFKNKFSFHVVVDPYPTSEGNTRFNLIPFDDEEKVHLGKKELEEI